MTSFAVYFLFPVLSPFKLSEIPPLLEEYITWTQTGDSNISNIIFTSTVDLTYQDGSGECVSTPFQVYLSKVESAARSAPRSMTVSRFHHFGNRATAYLTDQSKEGDFSLTHLVRLRKRQKQWRIHAIKIIDRTELTTSLPH